MANTTSAARLTAGNNLVLKNIKRTCNAKLFEKAKEIANEYSIGHALEMVLEYTRPEFRARNRAALGGADIALPSEIAAQAEQDEYLSDEELDAQAEQARARQDRQAARFEAADAAPPQAPIIKFVAELAAIAAEVGQGSLTDQADLLESMAADALRLAAILRCPVALPSKNAEVG